MLGRKAETKGFAYAQILQRIITMETVEFHWGKKKDTLELRLKRDASIQRPRMPVFVNVYLDFVALSSNFREKMDDTTLMTTIENL